MSEPAEERVPWPRFDVVLTHFSGESRARYGVIDYLTREHQFPANPFSKEAAGALLLAMRQAAQTRGETLTVQRRKGAVSMPAPARRERPVLPPQPKGGPGA